MAGNPSRRVLVVRPAAVAVVVAAGGGEPVMYLYQRLMKRIAGSFGGCYVAQIPHNSIYELVAASGTGRCPWRLQQVRQTFGQSICFPRRRE